MASLRIPVNVMLDGRVSSVQLILTIVLKNPVKMGDALTKSTDTPVIVPLVSMVTIAKTT